MLRQQRFAGDFSAGVKTCSNFSLRRLVGVNPSRPGFGELPGASPANDIRKYLREAHGFLCGGPNLVAPQREIMPRQPQNKIRISNFEIAGRISEDQWVDGAEVVIGTTLF